MSGNALVHVSRKDVSQEGVYTPFLVNMGNILLRDIHPRENLLFSVFPKTANLGNMGNMET